MFKLLKQNATICVCIVVAVSGILNPLTAAVAAFPGAQGGGAASIGGRGGKVIEVTNLNDSGAGSFRSAVATTGARIVIFRVAGIIVLNSDLIIYEPYLTIAGQTAPGSGITLAFAAGVSGGAGVLQVRTHDVIVRYIRARPGQGGVTARGRAAIVAWDAAYNVIFDHVSSTWSGYDALSTWNNNGGPNQKNITFQWCLAGEGLATHSKGFNSGSDIDANRAVMTDIDVHHTYTLSSDNRMLMSRQASGRVISNIWYNANYGFSTPSCGITQDFISNKYKHGPMNDASYDFHEIAWEQKTAQSDCMSGDPSLYIVGNLGPHNPTNLSDDNWASMVRVSDYTDYHAESGTMSRSYQRSTPMAAQTYPITVDAADTLDAKLLAAAPAGVGATARLDCSGNWVAARDAVDVRLIGDYSTLQGRSITSESDVGGYPAQTAGTACTESLHDGIPDAWKTAKGLSLTDATLNSKTDPATGYTYLEDYINGSAVASQPPPPPPPPGTYEAENAAMSNGATAYSCTTCSGGSSVGNIGTLQFTVNVASAGSYGLTIVYLNGATANRPGNLSVNGAASVSINFPVTGNWNTVRTTATNISLQAGNNTLTFTGNTTYMADLDRISIAPVVLAASTVYEAEASTNTLTGSAIVGSCAACSGGKNVQNMGGPQYGSLQFNNVTVASGGTYTLTFVFDNGSTGNANALVSVNGTAPQIIVFPPTGSWNTMANAAVTATMNAGGNTIKIYNTSTSWIAEVDKLTVGGN